MTTLESFDTTRYLHRPPATPAPNTKYAAAYARLSKDKHGDELGVTRQLEVIVPMLESLGYVPIIYIDNSVSATSGVVRKDYQRMVADFTAGKLHTIGCWDTSRLFRDNLEQEIFMRLAAELELDALHFHSGGEKDLCDYTGQFEFRINGAVNARHVAEMKAKQRAAFDQRAAAGRAFWPCRPFGFERPRRDGTGVKHRESEAALIRQAYKDVLRGRSMKEIAREWNAANVLTPTREKIVVDAEGNDVVVVTSGGNEWSGMAIRQLLLSGRNAGLRDRHVKRGGKIVKLGPIGKADWEPIVDEELFRGVEAMLRSRARTPNSWVRKHLLTSIAVCGKCRGSISATTAANLRPAYICAHKGCYGVRRATEDVDNYILALLGDRLAADDAHDLIHRDELDPAHVSSVQEKVASLLQVRKLQSKLAISGEITADECEENVAEINAKISVLQAEITEPARAEVLEEAIQSSDPRAYIKAASLDRRRAMISHMLTIAINPGQGSRQKFNQDLIVTTWKR